MPRSPRQYEYGKREHGCHLQHRHYVAQTLHEPLVCREVQRQQRLEFQREQREPQQQQRQQRESGGGGHEFTRTKYYAREWVYRKQNSSQICIG